VHKNHCFVATISWILLTISASVQAQRLPPDVVVSNPQVYEVTITTKFVVPKDRGELSALGVWHALPNARPWDGLDRTVGASAISFQPESGRVQHLATNESQNVFWEVREGFKAGKVFEFASSFRVRSVDRDFDVNRSLARWPDYHRNLDQIAPSVDVNLDSITDEIKKKAYPSRSGPRV